MPKTTKKSNQFRETCEIILDMNQQIALLQAKRDALISNTMKLMEIDDYDRFDLMYVEEVFKMKTSKNNKIRNMVPVHMR